MNQSSRVGVAVAVLLAAVSSAYAQKPLAPADTTEALLGEMVQRAAVIIAGEVYAVQKPRTVNGGSGDGMVEVDIRIDQGVRGGYIGMSYVLKETAEEWQKQGRELLQPQQSYVLLLNRPNADGTTTPVGGALGVLPVDKNFNVDLGRLHAAVKKARNASGTEQTAAPDSATAALGGGMPELEQPTIAFLALLRDLYILAGNRSGPSPSQNHPAPTAGR